MEALKVALVNFSKSDWELEFACGTNNALRDEMEGRLKHRLGTLDALEVIVMRRKAGQGIEAAAKSLWQAIGGLKTYQLQAHDVLYVECYCRYLSQLAISRSDQDIKKLLEKSTDPFPGMPLTLMHWNDDDKQKTNAQEEGIYKVLTDFSWLSAATVAEEYRLSL